MRITSYILGPLGSNKCYRNIDSSVTNSTELGEANHQLNWLKESSLVLKEIDFQ